MKRNTRMFVRYQDQIVVAEHVAFIKMPEYRIWNAVWTRCSNPNSRGYDRYGKAGITICSRWKDFINFYEDVGPRPTKQHSIDRYPDCRGNYEPGNVRWATKLEQALNTKRAVFVEFEGKEQRLHALALRFGVPLSNAYGRIFTAGWTVEEALTIPINTHAKPHGKNLRLTRKKAATTP